MVRTPQRGRRRLQVWLTKGQTMEDADSLRPGVRIRWV